MVVLSGDSQRHRRRPRQKIKVRTNRFHLDGDGRIRLGGDGEPFTGVATVPTKMEDGWLGPGMRVDSVDSSVVVAGIFRDRLKDSARKEVWVLYCREDGRPMGVEMVGCGGWQGRWSAREVFWRAFVRGVPRVSLVSCDHDCVFAPRAIDLDQRRMFRRAAELLGIVIDHQIFVGRKGFSELTTAGAIVCHDWDQALPWRYELPEIYGKIDRVVLDNHRFAATLQQRIASADEAEALARRLLDPTERVAVAVLHVAESGQIAGVFPVGGGDWLDAESARLAFAAGMRGFCHRVLILASGEGEDWQARLEMHLGPSFLEWIEESYLRPSLTVLVRPSGRVVWGAI